MSFLSAKSQVDILDLKMRKPPAYATPEQCRASYEVPLENGPIEEYFLLEGVLDTLDLLQRAMKIQGLDSSLEEIMVPKAPSNDDKKTSRLVSVCQVDKYSWTVLHRLMKMMACRMVYTEVFVDGKKTIASSFLYPEN